jgi:hypothetical protein
LAQTGSDVGVPLIAALSALVLGGLLLTIMMAVRRRRTAVERGHDSEEVSH